MIGPVAAARLVPDRWAGVVADHVFAGHRVVLAVSFGTGRARLGLLARDGCCCGPATRPTATESSAWAQAAGPAAGLSRLAAVGLADLADTDHCARMALRWEALAADGKVFPALEADVMLTPAGEQITLLAVAGTYRRPSGWAGAELDQAIVRRCAAATIRGFMARIACALVRPAGATGPAGTRPPRRRSGDQEP